MSVIGKQGRAVVLQGAAGRSGARINRKCPKCGAGPGWRCLRVMAPAIDGGAAAYTVRQRTFHQAR